MSLVFDIGQGAGLAGASGVRPFLPPLLAGALAREDIGLDFDDSGYSFLEEPGFLVAVLALAVGAYALQRARGEIRALELGLAALGAVLGALLFAGSLDQEGHAAWPGLLAGVACALLAYVAVAGIFVRARRRVEGGAAALLGAYADLIALALAGLAILFPPLGLAGLLAFLVLLARGGGERGQKYEGLRVLR
jgi:hypothetical protein